MSATHKALGRLALKLRSTRSPGRAETSAGMVVRLFLPRTRPARPIWRIRRSTVQRATTTPSRFSWRHTLPAP
jgi:hypothetical protein